MNLLDSAALAPTSRLILLKNGPYGSDMNRVECGSPLSSGLRSGTSQFRVHEISGRTGYGFDESRVISDGYFQVKKWLSNNVLRVYFAGYNNNLIGRNNKKYRGTISFL